MDFFAAQQLARRKTRWLVLWFFLAVMGIIVSVYLPVAWLRNYDRPRPAQTRRPEALSRAEAERLADQALDWRNRGRPRPARPLPPGPLPRSGENPSPEPPPPPPFPGFWDGELFLWVCLFVGGVIAIGSLYKILQISSHGGPLIAEQMGGRMIDWGTDDPKEKRLLNVTEEMAIAAGIPVPVVFTLDGEAGLNAFAAGLSIGDGVVCVTRGLLEAMSRDELQGVVGHEISHLVNGDSRLNVKLIGVLYGITSLTVAGRALMRVRGGRKGKGIPIPLFGLFVYCAGFIGLIFGRIIQATVSREREYLADASAVQFTRNPSGLASALEKLRTLGSRVRHPEAEAASHLFFGAGVSSFGGFSSLFATHPPLDDRIARLGGHPSPRPDKTERAGSADSAAGVRKEISPDDAARARSLIAGLPEGLRRQARHGDGAIGVAAGLFLSGGDDVRKRQEGLIPPASLPAAREVGQWLFGQPEQGSRSRLVMMDLVLPVLRGAPEGERRRLLAMAEASIHSEGRVDACGFALYSLLRGVLSPSSAKRGELRLDRLDRDVCTLLAFIAHAGSEDANEAEKAYRAATACSPVQAPRPFPERGGLSPSAVSRALEHLALATPPYREKVLCACAAAIRHDGTVTPAEHDLFRAYAQSLDCPAPP